MLTTLATAWSTRSVSASIVNGTGLFACTLLLATGQLLFKQVGLSIRGQALPAALISLAGNTTFYLVLAIYGVATLLWIWLLSRIPLAQAYPWTALSVVVVPMLSIMLFGEMVRPLFWVGVALIAAGIVITQYGFK
jgi:multidrug transporter EmrE-like cation transporter